ncbi:hypothetical protein Celaphus_00011303, partial [Cervus elaphus hippelaphus]
IIYEQEGVYIHSSLGKTNDQDSLISGILRVLEKDSSSVVEWTQAPKERAHRVAEHLNSYEAEWDM